MQHKQRLPRWTTSDLTAKLVLHNQSHLTNMQTLLVGFIFTLLSFNTVKVQFLGMYKIKVKTSNETGAGKTSYQHVTIEVHGSEGIVTFNILSSLADGSLHEDTTMTLAPIGTVDHFHLLSYDDGSGDIPYDIWHLQYIQFGDAAWLNPVQANCNCYFGGGPYVSLIVYPSLAETPWDECKGHYYKKNRNLQCYAVLDSKILSPRSPRLDNIQCARRCSESLLCQAFIVQTNAICRMLMLRGTPCDIFTANVYVWRNYS